MKTIVKASSILLTASVSLLLVGGWGCSRSAKMTRHLEQANQYYQAEEYNKAELEYVNVLRLAKKENPEVVRQLGLIYLAQGKIPQAFRFLDKAKELNPDDVATRVGLARTYLTYRQVTNALGELDFVLQKQPTNEVALELLPDTITSTNDVTETFQRLEKLRPQAEKTAGFHIALGKLYYRIKDTKQRKLPCNAR